MESRWGRNLHGIKKAAPYLLGATLTLSALIHPTAANAQERKVFDVYPQCGGTNIPSSETVMVVASWLGDSYNKTFSEYSMGQKPGECGNNIPPTSSIVLERINRLNLNRPDILTESQIPVGCPSWAVGYRVERVQGEDGLDFEPAAGKIEHAQQPDIRLKVHTDLIPDGSHFVSGQAYCETPEGALLTAVGRQNFAVQTEP